jgi:hypothetical protein
MIFPSVTPQAGKKISIRQVRFFLPSGVLPMSAPDLQTQLFADLINTDSAFMAKGTSRTFDDGHELWIIRQRHGFPIPSW